MIKPSVADYKKIQGCIKDYTEVHMSVCGSGCSCPCKQTSTIRVRNFVSYSGCNCTCGCNCNAPVFKERFSDQERLVSL